MLMNSTKLMFMMIIITSVIMVYSSSSFFMSWMSMEMNLIAFLPVITKSKKMKDQSMKYFIIQNISSSTLLLSVILNLKFETPINFEKFIIISLMMKMGMMPFHLWMINLMEKLSWMNCFLMNSIQKMSPMLIIPQMINFKLFLLPMTISLLFAPIAMMKMNSMKKLIGYSSIYNSPWMIVSIYISKKLFVLFFFIYSTLNLLLMKKMKMNNMMFLNQMTEKSTMTKMNLMINFISISGMPPTMGFFPKWMILMKLNEISWIISMMMLFSSFISTFIYMKMISSIMMNQTTKKKFFKMKKINELEILINIMGMANFLMFKPN
uniref:NADH dehydrogenase subunit 2 n=1 Tax=Neosymplana vittatum TaxID=2886259 RepID=UPI001E718CE3|nr:NADH dehydrogenase subunit 2 [Neosymplana vittatum]UDL71967.1 NADH dehydrogenase subunit 2 [Neosymplana vittatum]